jgi:uncharacterized membrane protein YbhN (UPF0104 family)
LLDAPTLDALRQALREARPVPFVAAVLLSGVVQWLRAWRFAIMSSGALALPRATLVAIACQVNLFNFLLPFRLGEVSFPVLMRLRLGQPLAVSSGVLVLARLFDLATVGAILLGTAAILRVGGEALTWPLAGASALLALTPFALIEIGRLPPPSRLPARFALLAEQATLVLRHLRARRAGFAAVGLSLALWVVFGGLAYLAAGAVTDGIGLLEAMFGAAATNIAFALPINGLAGLGPAQAAWVAAVGQTGMPWSEALTTALAVHAAALCGAVLFGGAAFLKFGRGGGSEVGIGARQPTP